MSKKNETPEERLARLEYLREWRRKKKESDPDYWKRNYQTHKDLYIQWSKDHSYLQKEKYSHYYNGSDAVKQSRQKSFRKRLKDGTVSATNALRRQRMSNPLSKLHSKETRKFYVDKPEGYHVDHIVPLKGENVSGLHVPWNLQYLTIQENKTKSNKF